MSKQASPAVVGGFVVGAVGLIVAGVLVFGSGRMLSETLPFVMYFDGSIKGLRVGAPVSFRGVQVGEVTDIKVVLNVENKAIQTPVYAEVDPSRIVAKGGPPPPGFFTRMGRWFEGDKSPRSPHGLAEDLIQRGLRAQLEMQSLLTGQLSVQLDLHPDTPIRRLGLDPDVPEMPTIQSRMREFAKRLEDMRIDDLVEAGIQLTQNLEALVGSPELADTLKALRSTSLMTEKMMSNLDARVDVLAKSFIRVSEAAQATLKQAEETLAMEDGAAGRLAARLNETAATAQGAFKQTEATLGTIQDMLREESPLRYDLAKSLEELAAAARSVRVLVDYLERHPEAVLVGKGNGAP